MYILKLSVGNIPVGKCCWLGEKHDKRELWKLDTRGNQKELITEPVIVNYKGEKSH